MLLKLTMTFSVACGAPEGIETMAVTILVASREIFWPEMITVVVVLLSVTEGVTGALSGGFGGELGSVMVSSTF